MGNIRRAISILLVSSASIPSYTIFGFYYVFPDLFRWIWPYIIVTVILMTFSGSELNEPVDIIIASILSSAEYLIIFHILIILVIEPNLYSGAESYYILSSLFVPGFFYFLVFIFISMLLYSIGFIIIRPKVLVS